MEGEDGGESQAGDVLWEPEEFAVFVSGSEGVGVVCKLRGRLKGGGKLSEISSRHPATGTEYFSDGGARQKPAPQTAKFN